jgi:hypothetical protein
LLVRYYPDQTGDLINQALTHLVDIWVLHIRDHPSAHDADRVRDLLPRLSVLPSRRGRTNVGQTYYLYLLVIYEQERKRITKCLGVKAWKSDPQVSSFEIEKRAAELHDMYPDLTQEDLRAWARLSPSEIAYRFVVRHAPALTRLTPRYLKQSVLPKMRRLARELDTAVKLGAIRTGK